MGESYLDLSINIFQFSYNQYYSAEKYVLLYPIFNIAIDEVFKNKDTDFALQISTLSLHISKDY